MKGLFPRLVLILEGDSSSGESSSSTRAEIVLLEGSVLRVIVFASSSRICVFMTGILARS